MEVLFVLQHSQTYNSNNSLGQTNASYFFFPLINNLDINWLIWQSKSYTAVNKKNKHKVKHLHHKKNAA